jgi:hypothetical protein
MPINRTSVSKTLPVMANRRQSMGLMSGIYRPLPYSEG